MSLSVDGDVGVKVSGWDADTEVDVVGAQWSPFAWKFSGELHVKTD